MALLKAELLYAAQCKHGRGLRERVLSRPDLLGQIGCTFPRITNALLEFAPVRALMERTLGLSSKRTLPKYADERFDRWFARRSAKQPSPADGNEVEGSAARHRERGTVILWDDTFVRYNEPHIGKAAVRVLEALGYRVSLARGRKCCGRPAFSQGNLDVAAHFARHNLAALSVPTTNAKHPTGTPDDMLHNNISCSSPSEPVPPGEEAPVIVFLEPSCYSMFVDDYRELKIPHAEEAAKRCFLFEQFVDGALGRGRPDLFRERSEAVAIHAHCHAKSLLRTAFMAQLVEKIPGRRAKVLETGCCGMAGAFGMTERKRELSLQVAKPLLEKLEAESRETTIVASGTSCRHQISELSDRKPKHMAELLADALA
jgi:Fe-S oxidoreductase